MTLETELTELLNVVQRKSNAKIRTQIPGRILSFDKDNGPTATVQPTVQSAYYDTETEEVVQYTPAPVANCPVYFPAGGGYSIRFPLDVGDECVISVAERSIDEWMATGNAENTPRDLRRFDISDAIVYPGLKPAAAPLANFDADSLEIKHSAGGVLRVSKDGKIYLGNSTQDLVSLVDSLMTQVSTLAGSLVTTALGPQPLSQGAAVATAVATLKTQLGLIKE